MSLPATDFALLLLTDRPAMQPPSTINPKCRESRDSAVSHVEQALLHLYAATRETAWIAGNGWPERHQRIADAAEIIAALHAGLAAASLPTRYEAPSFLTAP